MQSLHLLLFQCGTSTDTLNFSTISTSTTTGKHFNHIVIQKVIIKVIIPILSARSSVLHSPVRDRYDSDKSSVGCHTRRTVTPSPSHDARRIRPTVVDHNVALSLPYPLILGSHRLLSNLARHTLPSPSPPSFSSFFISTDCKLLRLK